MGRKLLFRLVATCVFFGCCFLVTPMLSVGVSSELSYSNGHKNPKEVSEAVQFTLNRKPKILLQWIPHASHKIKLAVRGDFPKASGDYKWLSSDMRIVYVSSYGKRPGIAIVKTVSNRDPQNFDEILVRGFASHDNVSCDMILEPILNNDQLEPNCILKPNLISMDCIDMTLLVYSPIGGIIAILLHYFCVFRHSCYVMHDKCHRSRRRSRRSRRMSIRHIYRR